MAHFRFCTHCCNITTTSFIGGRLAQYCIICKIEYELLDEDRQLYVIDSDDANILNRFATIIRNSQFDPTVARVHRTCLVCGWSIAANIIIGDMMIIIFVCDKCGDISKN
jgi:hypothetical protein